MNLYQDKDAFKALLSDVSQKAGILSDIIEKDYYLTYCFGSFPSINLNFRPISREGQRYIRQ